jgi:hypothetical protein
MDSPQHAPQTAASPASTSAASGPNGLLLSRDLIFTTKIRTTAAELGYEIRAVSDVKLAESLIAEQRPRVVFVDLTAGDLCAPSALRSFRKLAGASAWFVAFGPHVDTDVLAAASAAGCQAVMPRSRFASALPELIRRYFSESPS